jgi:hypothetical protein
MTRRLHRSRDEELFRLQARNLLVSVSVQAGDDIFAAAARAEQDEVHVGVALVLPDPPAEIGAVECRQSSSR